MTSDLRQQIRNAINQQARARRQALIDGGELEVCKACGADRESLTAGCKGCVNRHYKWTRRSDPAFLENERMRQRAARARCQTTRLQG